MAKGSSEGKKCKILQNRSNRKFLGVLRQGIKGILPRRKYSKEHRLINRKERGGGKVGLSKCQRSAPLKHTPSLHGLIALAARAGKKALWHEVVRQHRGLAVMPSSAGRVSPGSYFMLRKNVVIAEDRRLLSEDGVQRLGRIQASKITTTKPAAAGPEPTAITLAVRDNVLCLGKSQ
ncbi:hypothetical protein SRHO_G00247440 [Serrasalmus rhombeus]